MGFEDSISKILLYPKNTICINIGNTLIQMLPCGYLNLVKCVNPMFHTHPYYELTFVDIGTIDVIDEKSVTAFDANDVFVIPPAYIHYRKSKFQHDNRGLYNEVSFRFIFKRNNIADAPDIFTAFSELFKPGKVISFRGLKHLKPYFTELGRMQANAYSRLRAESLLTYIFISFLEEKRAACYTDDGREPDLSRNAPNDAKSFLLDRYLLDNYTGNISVFSLSSYLGISVRQTQRIITHLYGQTFRQKVMRLRIDKARFLLIRTNHSVSDIASSCGYSSVRGLHASFRQLMGTTPDEYRSSHKSL